MFTEEDTKETTLIHGKQVRLASISGQPLLLSKGRYNLRKLHELPVQLIRSQMLDELKSEVLCNFEWLSTKIEVRTLRLERRLKKKPLICCSQRARPYYYATGSISPPAGRLGRVGKRFFRGLALMIKYVRPFLDHSPARLPQDLRSCRRAIDEEPLAS